MERGNGKLLTFLRFERGQLSGHLFRTIRLTKQQQVFHFKNSPLQQNHNKLTPSISIISPMSQPQYIFLLKILAPINFITPQLIIFRHQLYNLLDIQTVIGMQQKLQQIKSGDSNLYEHLVQVMKHMLVNNDRDSYHLFEYYSQKVKNKEQPGSQFRAEEYHELQAYVEKMKALLNKPSTGAEEEPAEPAPTGYVPNLMQEAKWLERCGVGFGEQLTYTIFKSLQRLSITKQIKQLKFWGKIIGTEADYYIAQSPAEPGQQELAPDVEPKGTGINKSTYYVCTDLNAEWKQLPIITPAQLATSRRIKYLFSGDLTRQLYTNPHFPGKEAHLLKCQIVRISYGCTVVPRTMYAVNADDKKEIDPPSEEWKLPGFEFLSQLGNWVHHPQNILKNGRMTILKPEIPEGVEVDEQKLMKQLEAKDPLQQRLKPIAKDHAGTLSSAWTIRRYGDCSEYKAMSRNPAQQVNHGFLCLRSLVWQGWHTVYHNKQWINLYIGNGFKSTTGWYFPREPETVLQEVPDREECPQPNFPPELPKVDVVPQDDA